MNLRIKICGITRRQDAELAQNLGATDLGFIFAPSPRQVTAADVAQCSMGLPDLAKRFGVFVDPELEFLHAQVDVCGLTGIQLHGNESLQFVEQVKKEFAHLEVMKVITPQNLNRALEFQCDSILIEPVLTIQAPQIIEQIRTISRCRPLFIAGGVNSSNVMNLLQSLNPSGVDLSSAVESRPGIKDPQKMKTFFAQLRGDHENN